MNSTDFLPLLLDAALKSALVLLIAMALLRLLPKFSAATRHLFLAITLCACLSLPLLTLILPSWRIPVLPAPPTPFVQSRRHGTVPVTKITYAPPLEEFAFEPPMPIRKSVAPKASLDWSLIVAALWAIGAWIVLAQMLIGTVLVWLLKYKTKSLQSEAWQALREEVAHLLGLKRNVTIFVNQDVTMPMTFGIWRPVVLLPAEALQWSREQLKTVLLHEFAHIKRYDCMTQLLAGFACSVYWFNPLVWVAARQLRVTREQACDDEVLAAGTRASDYASCLVGVAKSVESANYISPVAVGMACSQLEDRISSILHPARNRRLLSRRYVVMITLVIASLIIPLASFQPFTQAAAPPQIQREAQKSQEARRAMERAEVEARQIEERHRQEVEQQLRELEQQQRELTEVQQRELEQQLRELSALKENALNAEIKAQQEAELRKAMEEAQRGVEELRASEAQLRALEQELQAQQRELSQSELQKRQAEIEARQQALSESRERLRQEIERAVREGIERGVSRGVAESIERQVRDAIRGGVGGGIGSGIGSGIVEGISKGISDGIADGVSNEIRRRIELVLDQTYRELRAKQRHLESELLQLQSTYKAEHPSVKAKQKEIETIKEELRRFRR